MYDLHLDTIPFAQLDQHMLEDIGLERHNDVYTPVRAIRPLHPRHPLLRGLLARFGAQLLFWCTEQDRVRTRK